MHRDSVRFLLIGSLVLSAAAWPAAAQTQAERDQYEPLQGFAIREYQKENEAIVDLQKKLEAETDLVKGCGLLRESVGRLETVDKLLADLTLYATKLRQTKERKAAEKEREIAQENLKLKQGDIERMCAEVPVPTS